MSENEGEFKKRIQRLREFERMLNKRFPSSISKEINQIVNSTLDIVCTDIHEAAKEAPEIIHVVPIDIVELGTEGKTQALADSEDRVDGVEAAKWFKKWLFGGRDTDEGGTEESARVT